MCVLGEDHSLGGSPASPAPCCRPTCFYTHSCLPPEILVCHLVLTQLPPTKGSFGDNKVKATYICSKAERTALPGTGPSSLPLSEATWSLLMACLCASTPSCCLQVGFPGFSRSRSPSAWVWSVLTQCHLWHQFDMTFHLSFSHS